MNKRKGHMNPKIKYTEEYLKEMEEELFLIRHASAMKRSKYDLMLTDRDIRYDHKPRRFPTSVLDIPNTSVII